MKKKKILLIVLPIVLVVVIASVFAILYFATDIFKSNDQTFWKYFSNNSQVFSLLENGNKKLQKQFKETNSYSSNGTLTFSMQNGEENSQTIDVITTSRRDNITGRVYADATLKNQEAEILKVSYINSEDVYAIKCDEVLTNYIGFRNSNLKEFAKNMGVAENGLAVMPDSIDLNSIEELFQLTDAEKEHIVNTYYKVITNTISKEQYKKVGKKQITIEGSSYTTNLYQLTLDGDMIKQVIVNCLTTLKEDSSTLVSISNRLQTLLYETEYTDITNLASKIEEQINQIQNTTIDTQMTISVYEQKGKTVRTTIEISTGGSLTIDLLDNRAILTIVAPTNTADTTDQNENNVVKITLSKTSNSSAITNTIQIMPSVSDVSQGITISSSLGSIQNSNINNSYSISINGTENITTDISYDTSISAVTQVDEIMELKNSNTVIMNNYTKEQLTPFLQNIIVKAQEVLESKLQILGTSMNAEGTQNDGAIGQNTNETTNEITDNNVEI